MLVRQCPGFFLAGLIARDLSARQPKKLEWCAKVSYLTRGGGVPSPGFGLEPVRGERRWTSPRGPNPHQGGGCGADIAGIELSKYVTSTSCHPWVSSLCRHRRHPFTHLQRKSKNFRGEHIDTGGVGVPSPVFRFRSGKRVTIRTQVRAAEGCDGGGLSLWGYKDGRVAGRGGASPSPASRQGSKESRRAIKGIIRIKNTQRKVTEVGAGARVDN